MLEEKAPRSLLQSMRSVFGRQVYTAVVGLAAAIINARFMGPEGNGVYSTAMLIPNVMFAFLNMGLAFSTTYLINTKNINLHSAHRVIVKICLTISLTIIPVSIILYFYGNILFPNLSILIILLAVLIFPFQLLNYSCLGIFLAIEDFKKYNFISALMSTVSLMSTLVFIVLLRLGPAGALLAVFMGQFFACAIAQLAIKKMPRNEKSQANARIKDFLSYGVKSGASDAIQFINYRADIYFVNLYWGRHGAGLYGLAINLCERLWMISDAVVAVVFPRFTKQRLDTNEIFFKTMVAIAVIATAAAIAIDVCAHLFLAMIFGKEFEEAIAAINLLLPGIVIVACGKIVAAFLASIGKIGWTFFCSILGIVANISCNLYLTPHYGIAGAAAATSIGYAINVGVAMFLAMREIRRRSRAV